MSFLEKITAWGEWHYSEPREEKYDWRQHQKEQQARIYRAVKKKDVKSLLEEIAFHDEDIHLKPSPAPKSQQEALKTEVLKNRKKYARIEALDKISDLDFIAQVAQSPKQPIEVKKKAVLYITKDSDLIDIINKNEDRDLINLALRKLKSPPKEFLQKKAEEGFEYAIITLGDEKLAAEYLLSGDQDAYYAGLIANLINDPKLIQKIARPELVAPAANILALKTDDEKILEKLERATVVIPVKGSNSLKKKLYDKTENTDFLWYIDDKEIVKNLDYVPSETWEQFKDDPEFLWGEILKRDDAEPVQYIKDKNILKNLATDASANYRITEAAAIQLKDQTLLKNLYTNRKSANLLEHITDEEFLKKVFAQDKSARDQAVKNIKDKAFLRKVYKSSTGDVKTNILKSVDPDVLRDLYTTERNKGNRHDIIFYLSKHGKKHLLQLMPDVEREEREYARRKLSEDLTEQDFKHILDKDGGKFLDNVPAKVKDKELLFKALDQNENLQDNILPYIKYKDFSPEKFSELVKKYPKLALKSANIQDLLDAHRSFIERDSHEFVSKFMSLNPSIEQIRSLFDLFADEIVPLITDQDLLQQYLIASPKGFSVIHKVTVTPDLLVKMLLEATDSKVVRYAASRVKDQKVLIKFLKSRGDSYHYRDLGKSIFSKLQDVKYLREILNTASNTYSEAAYKQLLALQDFDYLRKVFKEKGEDFTHDLTKLVDHLSAEDLPEKLNYYPYGQFIQRKFPEQFKKMALKYPPRLYPDLAHLDFDVDIYLKALNSAGILGDIDRIYEHLSEENLKQLLQRRAELPSKAIMHSPLLRERFSRWYPDDYTKFVLAHIQAPTSYILIKHLPYNRELFDKLLRDATSSETVSALFSAADTPEFVTEDNVDKFVAFVRDTQDPYRINQSMLEKAYLIGDQGVKEALFHFIENEEVLSEQHRKARHTKDYKYLGYHSAYEDAPKTEKEPVQHDPNAELFRVLIQLAR